MKITLGIEAGSYLFDASAKTVTFNEITTPTLNSIGLITNVTANVIIYQFNKVGKGGTFASNVLTLDYDTTLMSDSDILRIDMSIPDSDSPIVVFISGLTGANYGQIDVSTTEVAVPTLANSKTTCIKALAANAQKVYVGKTGVSSTSGFELSAGDSIEIDTTDVIPWFMIASSGTQRICYIIVS